MHWCGILPQPLEWKCGHHAKIILGLIICKVMPEAVVFVNNVSFGS